MNILTDILSLIRRGIYTKTAGLDDVLVLGVNEEPDMTGVASPIPYKSVKVIKVRDFKVAAEHCDHANSPAIPASGTGQVYQKTVVDATTQKCTVFYRSLKSMSSNLTLATSSDDDYIEITTQGEPNLAANLPVGGKGIGVWKDKVGETLNFRKLLSTSSGLLITQGSTSGCVEFALETSTVENTIASGKAYMTFTSGTAGGNAMIGTKYKIMSSASIGSVTVASPYGLDWTDSDLSVNNDASADVVQFLTNEGAVAGSLDWVQSSTIPAGQITSPQGGSGLILKVVGTDPTGTGAVVATPPDTGFQIMDGGTGYDVDDTISINPGNGGASVAGKITVVNNYQMPNDLAQQAIVLAGAMKAGDRIVIDWIITNSRSTGSQAFNVLLGWFDTGTMSDGLITYLRDVKSSGTFTQAVNGKMLGIGQTAVTLTSISAGSTSYAVFGFNFPDAVTADQYNISWTLTTEKTR